MARKQTKQIDPVIAASFINLVGTKWADEDYRKAVLLDIHSEENKQRKADSFKQYEVFNDRFDPFVQAEMERQLGKSADEAPRISCVNLAKTIVKNEASIYKSKPERSFGALTAEQTKKMEAIYSDGKFNITLKKQNKYFKLQHQSWLMIVPKGGKLKTRILFPHHVDVITSEEDPDEPVAFIISVFDKAGLIRSDGVNQKIANPDSYKRNVERYTIWDKDVNFIMNGLGEFVTPVIQNPIGMIPIVEACGSKDGDYFVRQGQSLAEFTVQYNVCLSDLQQIVRLQGFSIMVYTGDPQSAPKDIRIGPNLVLILPRDAQNPEFAADAKFISPTPDIEGSIKVLVNLLANFLSSRGVDTSVIASDLSKGTTYSSGLERLLAMIDKFEASQDDIDLFTHVENRAYEIVKKYVAAFSLTDQFDDQYSIGNIDASTLSTKFAKPEAIKTDADKIEYATARIKLGIWTEVEVIMSLDGIDQKLALQKLEAVYANRQKVNELKAKYQLAEPVKPEAQGDQNVEDQESENLAG